MNDLMRPALYQARHRIVPLVSPSSGATQAFRVVGPVCESSDDFGEHDLSLEPFFGVAILDAGAYGYTMASRYNGRPLPGEVFLRGGSVVSMNARRSVSEWVTDRVHAGHS
jgi:diaminopimelate decarboxylase